MQSEHFLFFGCWGGIYKNIEFTKTKKTKHSSYLEKIVYETLEKYYQNRNGYKAVILPTVNVYTDPERRKIYTEKQLRYDIENCISRLNSNTFLIGVGSNDIENCDILNYQKNYKGKDTKIWKQEEYYSVNFSHVKFIFINTNLYQDKECDKNITTKHFKKLRKKQFEWLKTELETSSEKKNIVIGHISPISYRNNTEIETGRQKELLDDLLKLSDKIALYLCVGKHNQQLLEYRRDDNILRIGLSGSGSDNVDDLYCLEKFPKLKIIYTNKGIGGIHLKIRKGILILNFISGKKKNGDIKLITEEFQYGDDTQQINQLYKTVKNYEDLLKTNVHFFEGKLPGTFYYLAPWGEGSDQNDHLSKSTRNLIKLNSKYRIFTHNGQSNYKDEDIIQRSFIDFYIEIDKFYVLKELLDTDNRIWYVADLPGGEIISKFPSKKGKKEQKEIVVTYDGGKPYTIVNRTTFEDYRFSKQVEDFPNILEIFKSLVSVSIICKNNNILADEILLKYMEKIKKANNYTQI